MFQFFLDLYGSFFVFEIFEYIFFPFFAFALLVTVPCLIHAIFFKR